MNEGLMTCSAIPLHVWGGQDDGVLDMDVLIRRFAVMTLSMLVFSVSLSILVVENRRAPSAPHQATTQLCSWTGLGCGQSFRTLPRF